MTILHHIHYPRTFDPPPDLDALMKLLTPLLTGGPAVDAMLTRLEKEPDGRVFVMGLTRALKDQCLYPNGKHVSHSSECAATRALNDQCLYPNLQGAIGQPTARALFWHSWVTQLGRCEHNLMSVLLDLLNGAETMVTSERADWRVAADNPFDQLPEWQALTFQEQVRLRCHLWLRPSGVAEAYTADWLLAYMTQHPDADSWQIYPVWAAHKRPCGPNGQYVPPPLYGLAEGSADIALEVALGHRKAHPRRPLSSAEQMRLWLLLQPEVV